MYGEQTGGVGLTLLGEEERRGIEVGRSRGRERGGGGARGNEGGKVIIIAKSFQQAQ